MNNIELPFEVAMSLLRILDIDKYNTILNIIRVFNVSSISSVNMTKTYGCDKRDGVIRQYVNTFGYTEFSEAVKDALSNSTY